MSMLRHSVLSVCSHPTLPVFVIFTDNVDIDVRPEGIWDDFHVTDGRIITGTNPQSAKSTAEEIVRVFEKL